MEWMTALAAKRARRARKVEETGAQYVAVLRALDADDKVIEAAKKAVELEKVRALNSE